VDRTGRAALVAAGIATVATVLIVAWPAAHFAYRGRQVHIALETAAALVAQLAAFLVVGRFQRRRRLDDLLLALALVLFALTNLVFLAAPSIFSQGAPGHVSVWSALACGVFGALAFAAAAFAPRRRVAARRATALMVLLAVGLLGVTALVVGLLEPRLPTGVEARLRPETSDRPRLIGHPAVLGAQLLTMALLAAAAVGFVRRARSDADEFLGWLAAASVLGAFARLHYFLYPSLYTEWIYSGDVFRLLFYATVLMAAAREIRGYWWTTAVLDERRRLARDLHDGLAQELASVSRNLQWTDTDDEAVGRARAAAQRALTESRRAIAALSEPFDRPLGEALGDAVREVAERERTHVALTVEPGLRSTLTQREALVRIACEAVTNAARHGGAPLVRVRLGREGDGLRMRVSDTGTGFDPDDPRSVDGGFGLVSMRERARRAGGRLRISSAPGRGTDVEVEL
jgi:signal transduction histidine kinase